MPIDLSGINPEELPDQPWRPEKSLLSRLPDQSDQDILNAFHDQAEVSIRKAPDERDFLGAREIWNTMAGITKDDPEKLAAKAQNAMALSDMLDISPAQAFENHDELSRELGIHDKGPSRRQVVGYGLLYPLATAFMSHPVMAGLGFAAYQALAEAESWAISRSQQQEYQFLHNRGLRELLPDDTNTITADVVELIDLLGKGAMVAGGSKLPKPLFEKFTKQITTQYKIPKDVYVPAEAVKTIFHPLGEKSGYHITPEELELIRTLGSDTSKYKDAVRTGLWFRVPGEKMVHITDKPYWAKLKGYIGIKPYQKDILTKLGEPPKRIGSGLLLAKPETDWWAKAQEDPVKAPSEPAPISPAAAPAGAGMVTRDNFAQKIKEAFGSSDEEAAAAQALVDARAEAWSRVTGKPAEEYYPTFLEDIVKGGKPGSGEIPYPDIIKNADRALDSTAQYTIIAEDDKVQTSRGKGDLPPERGGEGVQQTLSIFEPEGFTPEGAGGEIRINADLRARIDNVQSGTFHTNLKSIETPADAASLLRPIWSEAQENMVAIVTDGNNRPLAVIRHTIGAPDYTMVDPSTLLGAVADVPGAKKAWFSHNHPSGRAVPSNEDKVLMASLEKLTWDTGIESKGMVIVTSKGTARHFDGSSGDGYDIEPSPGGDEGVEVPVLGRIIKEIPEGPELNDAAAAMEYLGGIQGDGILLVNPSGAPTAWVPMSVEEMSALRTGSIKTGAALIYRVAHRTNGRLSFIKMTGSEDFNDAKNLIKFLNASRLGVRDVFVGKELKSAVQENRGVGSITGEFYQEEPLYAAGRKGSVEFLDSGRAIIRSLKNPDVSTVMHEMAHVFRREVAQTEPELLQGVEGEFGVAAGKWTRQAEEAFADSYLRYLKDGKAPTENLKTVFERFSEWLSAIWEKIKNAVLEKDISPQVRDFFDTMMGGSKSARKMTGTEGHLLEGAKTSPDVPAVPGAGNGELKPAEEQITAPMDEPSYPAEDIQAFLEETDVAWEDRFGKIDEEKVAAYEEQFVDVPAEALQQAEAQDLEVLYQAQRRLNRTTKVEMRRQIMEDMREIRARLKARKALKEKASKYIDRLKKVKTDELPREQKHNVEALLDGFMYGGMTKKTEMRLRETREYLQKNPNCELPDYVLKDIERLDKKNIREIAYRDLESIYMAVMHEIKLAQQDKKIRLAKKDLDLATAVSLSIAEMRPPTVLESSTIDGTEGGPGRKGLGRLTKKLLWDDSLHYDLLVEMIAGKNSTIDQVLYAGVKTGIRAQLQYRQASFDKFKQDLKDMGFMERHHIDDLGKWLKEPVTVGRITLTRDQRMSLFRHWKNKDNKTAILKGGFGFRKGKDPNKVFKITKDELYKIIQSLDPAETEFSGVPIDNFTAANYDSLNKVFELKNGYDLPRVEGSYWPKDVMSITRSDYAAEDEDALEALKGQWVRPGVSKGMLNKRVGSAKPLYLKGLTETFNDLVMKSGAYIGLEIPLSNASRLLYDKSFRYELEQRYSKDLWKNLEQGLRDIAGEYKSYSTVEEFITKYKNALVSSIFGLNPFVMAKQLLAYPLYKPYVDGKYMALGLLKYIKNKDEVMALLKAVSPEYRERLEGGFSRDVADVFKGDAVRRLTDKDQTLPEKMTAGIKLFDRVAVTPGMYGAFLQALAELQAGKLSPQVAEALHLSDMELMLGTTEDLVTLAGRYAEYATQRTQPMFGPEHRSALSRGNTLEKILTMFTEASNAMFNMVARMMMAYRRSPTDVGMKQIAEALVAIFIINTLGNTTVDAIRDRVYGRKGKGVGQRILDDWSGVFYFIRDLVPSITSHLENGPYGGYDPNNPMSKVSDTIVHTVAYGAMAIHEWYHGRTSKAEKYFFKFLDRAAEAVMMYYGLPYGTPKKAVEAAIRAAE